MVFRRSSDPARRIAALLGGGLFVTPYAMHYDAALLAPAAALMLTHRTRPAQWILAAIAGAVLCCAAIPDWGAAAVTAFTLWTALSPETLLAGRPALAGDGRPLDAWGDDAPLDSGRPADREWGRA
jgi:hypothetical protein